MLLLSILSLRSHPHRHVKQHGQGWLYPHFPRTGHYTSLSLTLSSLFFILCRSLGGQHRPVAASARPYNAPSYQPSIPPYKHNMMQLYHIAADRSALFLSPSLLAPFTFSHCSTVMTMWLLWLSCRFLIRIYFSA